MLRLAGLATVLALGVAVVACGGGGGKKPTATASAALKTQQACAPALLATPGLTPAATPTSGPPPTVAAQPTTTSDGLQIVDIKTGSGSTVKAGGCVTVNYTGWLEDGTIFGSSEIDGGPSRFPVVDPVIKGLQEGVPGMKVGGTRRLIIPPALAFGAYGNGSVPPNATLTFDIELLAVK